MSDASAVDGDVNDPDAALVRNDTLATAQPLSNPARLAGYVNRPGTGTPGRSFVGGDVRDLYRVALAAGQRVRLLVGSDGQVNDLDLALLDSDGTPLAVSDSITPQEEVVVANSAEVLIEVVPFAGAANYVLLVDHPLDPFTLEPLSVAAPADAPEPADFVPGEVIVRTTDGRPDLVSELGLDWERGEAHREMLVGCRDSGQRDRAFRALRLEHLLPSERDAPRPTRAGLKRDTRRIAKALRARKDVASADLNYVRRPSALPQDELFDVQWHYPEIDLPAAWDLVTPASGVIVAVVDTGVVLAHPDLAGQLVDGYDFIQNPQNSLDGDGCDADPDDPGDGATPQQSSFHGTHIAGTVAARTSLQPGGDTEGVAGVAWNARVMPLRVSGLLGATDFDVIQAIRYAAGLPNACGVLPEATADVINISLGGPGESAALAAAVLEVRSAGVTVVAAAGNDATDAPAFPAAHPGVISVSATDIAGNLASYSNFGSTIDVAAPGGDSTPDLNGDGFVDAVLSTSFQDGAGGGGFGYAFATGTSAAAPHVTGVVALMLGVNPDLGPGEIDALLAAGLLTRPGSDPLQLGHGLIDAHVAVRAALDARAGGLPPNPPSLRVEPAVLQLGAVESGADLVLRNVGGQVPAISIDSITVQTDDGVAWLAVTLAPGTADPREVASYRVSVNRALIPADGVYTGRVAIASSANDVEVPVIVVVSPLEPALDAGHHVIALLDAATRETLQTLAVRPDAGAYAYRFDAVPPGSYVIVAGSDSDNDGRFCDAGESCGGYPTRDALESFTVAADRTGLDFATAPEAPRLGDPGFAR